MSISTRPCSLLGGLNITRTLMHKSSKNGSGYRVDKETWFFLAIFDKSLEVRGCEGCIINIYDLGVSF